MMELVEYQSFKNSFTFITKTFSGQAVLNGRVSARLTKKFIITHGEQYNQSSLIFYVVLLVHYLSETEVTNFQILDDGLSPSDTGVSTTVQSLSLLLS